MDDVRRARRLRTRPHAHAWGFLSSRPVRDCRHRRRTAERPADKRGRWPDDVRGVRRLRTRPHAHAWGFLSFQIRGRRIRSAGAPQKGLPISAGDGWTTFAGPGAFEHVPMLTHGASFRPGPCGTAATAPHRRKSELRRRRIQSAAAPQNGPADKRRRWPDDVRRARRVQTRPHAYAWGFLSFQIRGRRIQSAAAPQKGPADKRRRWRDDIRRARCLRRRPHAHAWGFLSSRPVRQSHGCAALERSI